MPVLCPPRSSKFEGHTARCTQGFAALWVPWRAAHMCQAVQSVRPHAETGLASTSVLDSDRGSYLISLGPHYMPGALSTAQKTCAVEVTGDAGRQHGDWKRERRAVWLRFLLGRTRAASSVSYRHTRASAMSTRALRKACGGGVLTGRSVRASGTHQHDDVETRAVSEMPYGGGTGVGGGDKRSVARPTDSGPVSGARGPERLAGCERDAGSRGRNTHAGVGSAMSTRRSCGDGLKCGNASRRGVALPVTWLPAPLVNRGVRASGHGEWREGEHGCLCSRSAPAVSVYALAATRDDAGLCDVALSGDSVCFCDAERA
ncbi:predicted protein [Postia placenta Mad-698-R]|nr:predicted protein [Postia placenta Mad-698-R]